MREILFTFTTHIMFSASVMNLSKSRVTVMVPGDSPAPEQRCREGGRRRGGRHLGPDIQETTVGAHTIAQERERTRLTHWPRKQENISTAFSLFPLPMCCLVESGERGSEWAREAVFAGPGTAVPEVQKAAWITSIASV